jgi:uncharacterized protein (DUF1501 family)
MSLTRRQFIASAAATGGVVAIGGCASDGPKAKATGPATTGAKAGTGGSGKSAAGGTLVLVNLDGGNDALNTVAPTGDAAYARSRGALALDAAAVHALSDGFALHPSLERCKQLWDSKRLAVVHGVGFTELDRSHFHCRDVWQAGDTDDTSTGWVGRWLDAVGDSPIDAVAVSRTLPLLVRGAKRSAAVVGAGPFELPGDARLRGALTRLVAADAHRSTLAAAVATSNADLLTAVDRLGPVLAQPSPQPGDQGADDGDDDTYGGDGGLAGQLDAVARLIEADLPTRVFTVSLGGFDTHSGQAGTHAGLLGQFDTAVGAFVERMGERAVTVAAFSEFGRRVVPNASGGTDHGKGGVMLLAGTVRSGHHGDPPGLAKLDQGDLAVTTDFRSVFGGLAEGVLGFDAADLFGSAHKPLALV